MHRKLLAVVAGLVLVPALWAQSSNTFIIGAFNVENWNSIERHGQTNEPKPQVEKDAVVNAIATVRPDVLGIEEGDELIAARLTDGQSHVVLSTAQGMAIRFEESDVRAMGRSAYGVKGITLDEGDAVVSAESISPPREGEPAPALLTVTANGYGKRTELEEYRVQSRGGKGIITIKTTERNGPVAAVATVSEAEEVMLITNQGMLIRMPAKGISVIGRNTQGVRLITLESKDEQVVAVARVAEASGDEPQEGGGPDDGAPPASAEEPG